MSVQVSVCMATYNGSRWVGEQLASILAELTDADEVVIVDDASTDDTVAVITAVGDPRITLHARAQNRGYVATFEEAMRHATGEVIFLADQDDVWIPGRRAALLAAVEHGSVAASNLVLLGSDQPLPNPITRRPWRLSSKQSGWRIRNELRILAGVMPYFGCAMALRRDAVARVLPFPSFLTESHDLWIATFANRHGEMVHVDAASIRRRIHSDNASPSRPRGIGAVLRARLLLVRLWLAAGRR